VAPAAVALGGQIMQRALPHQAGRRPPTVDPTGWSTAAADPTAWTRGGGPDLVVVGLVWAFFSFFYFINQGGQQTASVNA